MASSSSPVASGSSAAEARSSPWPWAPGSACRVRGSLSGSGTSGSVTVMPVACPRRPGAETSGATRNRCVTHRPVEALAALADPVRRELVALLAHGEVAAGELADRFPVSRPAISRHLRVLREAGLVTARADGKRRLYALDPRPLRELDDWLEPYRDLWAQRLDALDTEIARGRRARRSGDRRMTEDLATRRGHRDPAGRRAAAPGVPPLLARPDRGRLGGADRARPPGPLDRPLRRCARARRHGHLRHDARGGRAHRRADDDPRVRPAPAAGGRVGAAGADDWRVDLDLWAEGGRTYLSFVQVFPAGADVADFAMGWHWYLDKLDAELGGRAAAGGLGRLLRRGGPGLRPRAVLRSGPAEHGHRDRARRSRRPRSASRRGSKPAGVSRRPAEPLEQVARDHRTCPSSRSTSGRARPARGPAGRWPTPGCEHVDGALYAVPNQQRVPGDVVRAPVHERDVVVPAPAEGDHLADEAGGELDCGDGDERPTVRHAAAP